MSSRPTLTRALSGDLHVRSTERMIIGCAVPYGRETVISEFGRTYRESFSRGAFARTIRERGAERVKLLAQHDRQLLPVGRAHLLREDPTGLHCELRVSQTARGDEILELVNDGSLDSLSIGFEAIEEDTRTSGLVVRTEVRLREISVVAFAAYDDARISGTRAEGTPVRDTAMARMANLRAQYEEFLR